MNQFLVSGALGFVLGIIGAGTRSISIDQLQLALIPAFIFLGVSLICLGTRKTVWPTAFLAFFFFGFADMSWHQDCSSSGHLCQILKDYDLTKGSNLEGTVFRPPDIRERYVILSLKVIRLIEAGGKPVSVKRGNVYVKVYPTAGDVLGKLDYGDRIELRNIGLRQPSSASNPGSFNMRTFLKSQGYFAQISVRKPDQITIKSHDSGNPVIRIAETVKEKLLITIKQTLPFPESSFLGGVLLGLRSGLSTEIKNTFRAAGVSHVLAVSGLHVTIITLFFMGIFNLLRIPRTTTFIVIISILILFTLITGARPSTVRAAIMNSVTLLFFYYRGIKLDRSLLLGISAAALFILARNPLLLTEASFLFSFSAVLSLAMLTRPIYSLCCKYLRGFFRTLLFIESIATMIVLSIAPALFVQNWQITITAIILLPAAFIADRVLPPFFEFRRWPIWFSTFFAAQISIQLGMLPLTAFYFKKISVAASMANFIAIPLIGVIVQLGLFAGIVAMIPFIGTWIALSFNAANWLFIKLFLSTAHFFGSKFPYPDVSPPKPAFLLTYYSVLLLIASWPWIKTNIEPRLRNIVINWRKTGLLIRISMIILISLYLSVQAFSSIKPLEHRLIITVLDPTMSFMGGGNSILIQTPDNKNFLVDAGPRYILRKKQPIPIMVGQKTIIPALLDLGARHLNGLIISSPRSNYAGGAASIISNPSISIDTIYHALPFSDLSGDESSDTILKLLQDPALFISKNRQRSELTAWAVADIFSAAKKRNTPCVAVKSNSIIYSENLILQGKSQNCEIKVLNPPETRYSGRYSLNSNCIVLQIDYGERKFLLTSNIGNTVQNDLLAAGGHLADVVQLPSNGSQYAYNPEFIGQPKIVFVSPLASRYSQRNLAGLISSISNSGIRAFSTSENGAITISTNGHDLVVKQYVSGESEIIEQ